MERLRQSSKVFMRSGVHTKVLAKKTTCGLALAVEYLQAIQNTELVDLWEESIWSLVNLAQWLRDLFSV